MSFRYIPLLKLFFIFFVVNKVDEHFESKKNTTTDSGGLLILHTDCMSEYKKDI